MQERIHKYFDLIFFLAITAYNEQVINNKVTCLASTRSQKRIDKIHLIFCYNKIVIILVYNVIYK